MDVDIDMEDGLTLTMCLEAGMLEHVEKARRDGHGTWAAGGCHQQRGAEAAWAQGGAADHEEGVDVDGVRHAALQEHGHFPAQRTPLDHKW